MKKASCRRTVKKIFLILIAATALAVAAWEINSSLNQKVRLVEYTYSSSELPSAFDGYRVFVVSDLHNAHFSDMIISHIRASEPDMIVLLGDLVQLPMWNFDQIAFVAEKFGENIPIYAVSGNHETQNKEYYYIRNELEKLGVNWLENKKTVVEKGGETITLAGIKDPKHDNVSEDRCHRIGEMLSDELLTDEGFSLVLNHRASLYPYLKDSGADLILSGHLHGGLIRLPFVGGIVNEDGELGHSDYEYGVVRESDGATMIVSGGCDKNPDKMRWFNQPEVLLINLKKE